MSEILIVDDERTIRKALTALLTGEGCTVRAARDGEEALEAFAEARPDLVLLDVMMPRMSGYAVCREIRRLDPTVPVVFLTAKDDEVGELRGFGLGCDDYISKAAGDEVLLARIRRALDRAAAAPRPVRDVVRFGAVEVDFRSGAVRTGGADTALLTRSERSILKLLAAAHGNVVTPGEIIEGLRGAGYACEDGLVYVHVRHIRGKLGPAASLVDTVRGAGYRLLP